MKRDENKLFLVDYQIDSKKRHTFTVCNTDDTTKPVHVVVEKDHKKDDYKDTIRCTCRDYMFRCYKNNIICKHCIYIIENGCKLKTSDIINGRKITDLEKFDERVKQIHVVKMIVGKDALFKNSKKEIAEDDSCPICLDDLTGDLLSCPDCSNYVHQECIKVWVRTNKNCVFCRSEVWKKFYS